MGLFIFIAILLFLGATIYLIKTYNTLIQARNRIKTQWAQIDVQLTRRTDLIPNLVECVKGYASHEKETLDKVISARNALINANTSQESIKANEQLSMTLPKLFAVVEAYPELKANANFLQLQGELKNVEEKIAYSRQFYNDTVLIYKNEIEKFPQNLFAGMFGFKDEMFFIAENEARQNVQIKF